MNISNVSSVLDMEIKTEDETLHFSNSSASSEEELREILKNMPDSKENIKSEQTRGSKSAVSNPSTGVKRKRSRSKITEETATNISSVSAFLDKEIKTEDETLHFSNWDASNSSSSAVLDMEIKTEDETLHFSNWDRLTPPGNSSASSEEEMRIDRNLKTKILKNVPDSKENIKSERSQESKSAVSNRETTTNILKEENFDTNESLDHLLECSSDYSSSSERSAKLTRRKRNSELQYQCSRCGYATAENSNFHRHMRIKHNKNDKNKDKPYACYHCNYSTSVKCNLETHMAVHKDIEPYKCEDCSFSTRHPSNLKKHVLIHLQELPFKCGDCSFGTKNKTALQNHMAIHSKSSGYMCDKCDYSTGEKYKLTRHKATHSNTKNFQCDQCDYSANRVDTLKRHKKRKH